MCSQVLTRFEKHHDSYAIMTGGLCRAPNSASQCRSVAVFTSGAFASARSLEPTWDRAVSFNRSQQKPVTHTCSRFTPSCAHRGNRLSAFRRIHPAQTLSCNLTLFQRLGLIPWLNVNIQHSAILASLTATTFRERHLLKNDLLGPDVQTDFCPACPRIDPPAPKSNAAFPNFQWA